MKKILVFFAAAALFAACEKPEVTEPVTPVQFSYVVVSPEANKTNYNVTVVAKTTDFTFVDNATTPVGVWYTVEGSTEKTEIEGTFNKENATIEGTIEEIAFNKYTFGVFAVENGNKQYSEGIEQNLEKIITPVVFSDVTTSVLFKTLTLSAKTADFDFVNDETTEVGCWYASAKDGEKTKVKGSFDSASSTISATAALDFETYFVGAYAIEDGTEQFTEAQELTIKVPTADIKDYQTKEFNGNVWMIENLHFVPEGAVLSEDPATGDLWYPSKPGEGTALNTPTAGKEFGYLYTHYLALGISQNKVKAFIAAKDKAGLEKYLKTFEGAQGICPEGWHVPTAVEYTSVFGKGMKTIPDNTSAPFFNSEVKEGAGDLTKANAGGYNVQLSGFALSKGIGQERSYNKLVISKCGTEEFNGKNKMSYGISSTIGNITETNAQFYGAMTNFAPTYIAFGGYNLALNAIESGCSVRCVKNAVK